VKTLVIGVHEFPSLKRGQMSQRYCKSRLAVFSGENGDSPINQM